MESTTTEYSLPKTLTCPITHQLFYDPVMANDGHTYEKEAILAHCKKAKGEQARSPMTKVPLDPSRFMDNVLARSQARGFIDDLTPTQREKLYENDDIYLPNSLKEQFAAMIINSDSDESQLSKYLAVDSDPRLRTVPLDQHGNTCLELVCQQPHPAKLEYVLKKLPETTVGTLKKSDEQPLKLLRTVAEHMRENGLRSWCNALEIHLNEVATSSAFYACTVLDPVLLTPCLKLLNINSYSSDGKFNTLLHQVVLGVAQYNDEHPDKHRAMEDYIDIIKLLISKGINTKAKNSEGLTADTLAIKLNLLDLAAQIKTEHRRKKLAPILAPLQSRIDELQQSNQQLEAGASRLQAQLSSEQERSTRLESSLKKTTAIVGTLAGRYAQLFQNTYVKTFKPEIKRSFTTGYNSGPIFLFENRYLLVYSKQQYKEPELYYCDLQKESTELSLITSNMDTVYNNGMENWKALYLGNAQILFLNKTGDRHNTECTLTQYDLDNGETINSFTLKIGRINFLHAMGNNKVFISADKSCHIMDLATGSLSDYQQLNLDERTRSGYIFCGCNLTPKIAYFNQSKYQHGIWLHNLETFSTELVTKENLYGLNRFYSSILRLLGPNKLAIQKVNDMSKSPLQIIDLKSKQTTESYTAPISGTGFNARNPVFADMCTIDGQRIATIHRYEQKGMVSMVPQAKIIIWDRKTKTSIIEKDIYLTKGEGTLFITYNPQTNLLYANIGSKVCEINFTPPVLAPEIRELAPGVAAP